MSRHATLGEPLSRLTALPRPVPSPPSSDLDVRRTRQSAFQAIHGERREREAKGPLHLLSGLMVDDRGTNAAKARAKASHPRKAFAESLQLSARSFRDTGAQDGHAL